MSQYCGEKIVEPILSSAEQWKENCLLNDGLIFLKRIYE